SPQGSASAAQKEGGRGGQGRGKKTPAVAARGTDRVGQRRLRFPVPHEGRPDQSRRGRQKTLSQQGPASRSLWASRGPGPAPDSGRTRCLLPFFPLRQTKRQTTAQHPGAVGMDAKI